MTGFEWISAIVGWFGQFIPRWVILNPARGAVKFKRGHTPIALGPGIHWYFPAMTELQEIPTARQAENLRSQTLITTDDKTIIVSGMIIHEVVDMIALLTKTHDGFATIKEITLTAIHDVICQMSWATLKDEQQTGKLDTKLKNAARKMLDEYGVRVVKVMLTDLAPTRVLKVVQSVSQD